VTNRLQNEISPYLLQHAENPVDWYPWGPQALQIAQEQDKPVFLSVGYAACHWCHVMAHESFEDPVTAAIMNEHFINIKVDREERPDIDAIYMDAVVALTGQGGWPMSVFLTPDGKPFYGGTYFPPTPRYNMPSFQDVLLHIAKQWKENREDLVAAGSKLVDHIASPTLLPQTQALDPDVLERAAEALFYTYDWSNGGWGTALKFPQAAAVEFLLQRFHLKRDKLALDIATHALDHMARGGMYDLIGGGFHRYAVDEQWLVPHFEKMLYDNALLARAYLHAWQVTQNDAYRAVFEETLSFMLREMRHPDGGFYSSLDADSEGEEGKYYVWTGADVRRAISDPDLVELAISAYGISESGNFEGKNIPYRATDPHQIGEEHLDTIDEIGANLQCAQKEMLAYREQRIRPATDDKVLTAWNGMTLTTLAEAARATGNATYLHAAQSLASFLLDHMFVEDVLQRSWRNGHARFHAYLEDHAALGVGLLALYQTDFNPRWYLAAQARAEEILEHFFDPMGGFFDTRNDHETLISRPKSIQDSPTPSGNSLAVALLLQLAAFTGEARYLEPAENALRAIQNLAPRYPSAFAAWLTSLAFATGPKLELALVGDPQDPDFNHLYQVVAQRYLPSIVIAGSSPGLADAPALLHDREPVDNKATAYLCSDFTCKLPTTSPSQLQDQVEDTLELN
jgi:uncharacterized protein YyaL (SSP411 family)